MTQPVIVFLNLRRTPLEHGAAIEAAHRQGFGVALIADTVPAGLPGHIVRVVKKVDTYDPAAVDAAVDEIASQHRIAGVVTWSDRDVETVSRVAVRLGLPAPPVEAARIARNKFLMRESLAGHPGTVTKYAKVTDWASLMEAAAEIGYPAVLKPTSGSGSKGIFVVHMESELLTAYDELMRYTRPEVDKVFGDNPNELILEEFLIGTEHSVEGFVVGGEVLVVGITDKQTSEPFRLEVAHTFPSGLPAGQREAVFELTRTVVGAIGLDHCAFHLECMIHPDGPVKLVEVAARVGGDFITSHLVGWATGVPFAENVIRVATGQRPVLCEENRLYAGLRKVMADRAGVFGGLDGLGEALNVPGVRHVVVERATGAVVALPPVDYVSSTLGAVLAVGDSCEALHVALDDAASRIGVRIGENGA